ncbi:hypothetical protein BKA69DRAFT_1089576 [Paraphysoderma sedebokerense]|nr:hypothetical protein BKA69DRAFT_1089576 [Paraphysoderma sedebokerense]
MQGKGTVARIPHIFQKLGKTFVMSGTNNIIYFYRTGDRFGEFSNFYSAPIIIDSLEWPTTEHYFQAQKFTGDPNVVEIIRKLPTPGDAARTGRLRSLPLRNDWESVKEAVMKTALRAKFTQHPELRRILLETGDAKLVEHTTNDKYWADGGGEGKGLNRLGALLMELRNELRSQ